MSHTELSSSTTSGEHLDYDLSQEVLDELSQPSGSYSTGELLDSYTHHFVDPRLLTGPNERPHTPLRSITLFGNRRGIMDSNPSSAPDTPPSEYEDTFHPSSDSSKQATPSRRSVRADPSASTSSAVENIMPSLLVPAPSNLIRTHRSKLSSSPARPGHKSKAKDAKHRSSTSADVRSSASLLRNRAPSTTSASSAAQRPGSLERSLKLRIPKRLPAPQFRFHTNPHADIVKHLRRIGLEQDAHNAQQNGWTAVYARDRIRDMLISSWRIAPEVGAGSADKDAPPTQRSSVYVIPSECGSRCAPPSHALAVFPSSTVSQRDAPSSSAAPNTTQQSPVLVPVHALMYGLQCLHFPDGFFDTSRIMVDDDNNSSSPPGSVQLPILKVHVPNPATFHITHEYLYSNSPQNLLIALIPVRLLARGSQAASSWTAAHDAHQSQKRTGKRRSRLSDDGSIKASELVPEVNTMPRRSPGAASSSSSSCSSHSQESDRLPDPAQLDVQERMIQALSFLPTSRLIDITVLIHSVWLNGAAIGLADRYYWNTLACAWDYVYQALALAQKRAKYCEDRSLPADLDISRLDVASSPLM